MRKVRLATLLLIGAVQILAFQNCDSHSDLISSSSFNFDGNGLISPHNQPDSFYLTSCLTSSTSDACLFDKNPVAQSGPIDIYTTWNNVITSRQTVPVTLRRLDTSGFLQNTEVVIMPAGNIGTSTSRLTADPVKKFRYAANAETVASQKAYALSQVSAYYFLNNSIEHYLALPMVAKNYVTGHALPIYPYITYFNGEQFQNAAFMTDNSGNAQIAFGFFAYANSSIVPLVLGGEVVTHEFGHAQVYFGSAGAVAGTASSTTNYCVSGNAQSGNCCISTSGCMRALNEGLADFFAATLFPNNPGVGELLANSQQAFTTCPGNGLYRDPRQNVNRTPSNVFNLCRISGTTLAGEIYTMATVYTSILWELRTKMKSVYPGFTVNGQAVDGAQFAESIFYEHLPSLTYTATYSSARLALKDAASALTSRFSLSFPAGQDPGTLIDAEFSRRGIQ